MSDPVQDAIAAAEAEIANPENAGGEGGENNNNGGNGGEGGGEQAPAELTAALEKDASELSDDDKTLINEHADSLSDEQKTTLTEAGVLTGGEQLDLAEVLEVAPAELTDEQKTFLVENQDDLTGKQVKALKEAGVEFEAEDDGKPVTGAGAEVTAKKPHEVPADDKDLVVKVTDANGNTIEITSAEDLPEDFIYKDSRQPLQVAEALADLRAKKADRAKQREENETIDDSNSNRERVAQLWSNEFDLLQADGTLPDGDVDWQNGKYGNAKIKEAAEGLFTFMTEENGRREKDGRPYVVSLRDVAILKARADAKAGNGAGKPKTQAEKDAEAKAKKIKDEKARKVSGANSSNENNEADDKPTFVKGSGQTIGDITEQLINESGK